MDTLRTLSKEEYPALLRKLEKLPKSMDVIGILPPDSYKYLCVVGSRDHSDYGKEACEHLIAGLAGYPIVIVSGLALGLDSIAHEAALKAGLRTIAFPGSSLHNSRIYPPSNLGLAEKIVKAGGALMSPFKRGLFGESWMFPVRNKLMAGIADATLVIEAEKESGTLITANDANTIGRTVLVVPGSIFSPTSEGSNNLIREGSTAVTCSEDILEALGFGNSEALQEELKDGNSSSGASNQTLFETIISPDEHKIIEMIGGSIQKDDLIYKLDLPVGYVNSVLAELEMKKLIKEEGGVITRRKL
jgi:DNA processing protein